MNVNLLKRFIQNSKKCNNIVNNLLCHNDVCTPKLIRHNSLYIGLPTYKNSFQSKEPLKFDSPKRCYCQGEDEKSGPPKPSHKLPPLMQFPPRVWPSLFKSFKNLILATFIIKPYLDPEFSIPDFVIGSKKAVEVVSHKLSIGEDLDGLVSSEVLPKLQESVSNMTLGQRDLIPVKMDDIYFAFPYQIGIMFNGEPDSQNQQRFVEITMVYHSLKDLDLMRSRGEEIPLNIGLHYQDRICICNYRFIKEFTKGVESDWTVNLLNHFRPVDDDY